MTHLRHLISCFLILSSLAACKTPSSSSSPVVTAQAESASTIPAGQKFKESGDFAASHILVAFAGASRANPAVTRSKEEAQEKAQQLADRLKEDPNLFEELAKMESDGPTGPNGGNLGTFAKGGMVKPFEDKVASLEVGKIAETPVETPFGFHIIRRNSLEKEFWAAEAFVVAFKSPQTPPNITRTEEEAKTVAEELKVKLGEVGFEELAKTNNDFDPNGAIFLGVFSEGNPGYPELLSALQGLKFNEATGYIALPFGYTFLKRVPVIQRAGSHILVSYQGAQNAKPSITRTQEEALAKAKDLIVQLQGNTSQFAEFAKQHSDGPSGPMGGRLGTWFKGKMVPEFEVALDSLTPGQITPEPVKTSFGYHVILCEEPE